MAIQLPFTIGPYVLAGPLNANFDALAQHLVVDADCSTLMALQGSKIAANSIPGDRLVNAGIQLAKMGLLSVDTPQLVDQSVTKGKHTLTVGQRITLAQLEAVVVPVTKDMGVPGAASVLYFLRLDTATVASVTSWVVQIERWDNAGSVTAKVAATWTPAAPIPSATTTVLGIVVTAVGSQTVTFNLIYLNNS